MCIITKSRSNIAYSYVMCLISSCGMTFKYVCKAITKVSLLMLSLISSPEERASTNHCNTGTALGSSWDRCQLNHTVQYIIKATRLHELVLLPMSLQAAKRQRGNRDTEMRIRPAVSCSQVSQYAVTWRSLRATFSVSYQSLLLDPYTPRTFLFRVWWSIKTIFSMRVLFTSACPRTPWMSKL